MSVASILAPPKVEPS